MWRSSKLQLLLFRIRCKCDWKPGYNVRRSKNCLT